MIGLKIAFHKAEVGDQVKWIGALYQTTPHGVTISLNPDLWRELLRLVKTFTQHNLIDVAILRSFTGKANFAAGLLFVWRPFLKDLWGALASYDAQMKKGTWKRPGRIWARQVRRPLKWLRGFLTHRAEAMSKSLYVLDHFADSSDVSISVDASPFGFGATLTIAGWLKEFFGIPLSEDDIHMVGFLNGATIEGNKRGKPWRYSLHFAFGSAGGSSVVLAYLSKATQ